MGLFGRFTDLFPACTAEEKEALVDALLKKAVVSADKSLEFELYAEGELGSYVATKNKVAPRPCLGDNIEIGGSSR